MNGFVTGGFMREQVFALLLAAFWPFAAAATDLVEHAAPKADEALISSTDKLATTNLHPNPGDILDQAKEHRLKLEMARAQRRARLFQDAKNNLTTLLQSDAPEDIQRSALLELALGAQEENDLTRAQQTFAQFLSRWPQDRDVPEILLRQGLIYRQMGAQRLAVGKFYAVLTSALVVKNDSLDRYQRLVLQAQAEIADTHFLEGKVDEAALAFSRLLKLDNKALNRAQIRLKLLRCLVQLGRDKEVIIVARECLDQSPELADLPEVRFHLAGALKRIGATPESLRQVMLLLQAQTNSHPETLAYWQQRAGNEIANQLYQEGDYLSALDIYTALAPLNPSPAWQVPVWYQIGLIFEKLDQPLKATEFYGRAMAREADAGADVPPSLRAVLDMAKWRHSFLTWHAKISDGARDFRKVTNNIPKPTASP